MYAAWLVNSFSRRLFTVLENGEPNPDYLPPGAISLKDWFALVKLLQDLYPSSLLEDDQRQRGLDGITAMVAKLDAAEAEEQGLANCERIGKSSTRSEEHSPASGSHFLVPE